MTGRGAVRQGHPAGRGGGEVAYVQDPVGAAVEELRSYANQRDSVEQEGSKRLFRTNQFVVATCFENARASTFTGLAEHYGEAHRSHSHTLHAALRTVLPNAALGRVAPEQTEELKKRYATKRMP